MPVRVFQSRYTIAVAYCPMFLPVSQGLMPYPSSPPLSWGLSQDYVGSMLLVLQLKLLSRCYRAVGCIAAMPCPFFPSFFVSGRENPHKKRNFLPNPKFSGKEGKRSKKQPNPHKEKNQGIPPKQGKEGQGTVANRDLK